MTSKKIILKSNSVDIENDLKYISAFVFEQRKTNLKSIKNLYKEHKKHLHIAEYNLIVNLFKNLQSSLFLEYLLYLNSKDKNDNTYYLFDAWGMDKIARIYSISI